MAAGLSIYCWCAAGDATAADRDSHEVMAVGWYVIFSRPSTMDEMTAFYGQTLGLPLMLSMRGPQNKDLFWGGEDIDVDVSHHGLELPLDPREADPDAARQIPFFRTDDLTAWLATLSARGAKVVAPRTTAHGRRMRARLEATGLRFPYKLDRTRRPQATRQLQQHPAGCGGRPRGATPLGRSERASGALNESALGESGRASLRVSCRSRGARDCDDGAHGAAIHDLDARFARFERGEQDCNRCLEVGVATHENIGSGEAGLGPSVQRDMGFSEQHDPGHAAARPKMVEMTAEHRRACRARSRAQQTLERARVAQQGCTDT
jgi:predicted enzyme related to lactoylglutathione lyase